MILTKASQVLRVEHREADIREVKKSSTKRQFKITPVGLSWLESATYCYNMLISVTHTKCWDADEYARTRAAESRREKNNMAKSKDDIKYGTARARMKPWGWVTSTALPLKLRRLQTLNLLISFPAPELSPRPLLLLINMILPANLSKIVALLQEMPRIPPPSTPVETCLKTHRLHYNVDEESSVIIRLPVHSTTKKLHRNLVEFCDSCCVLMRRIFV